MRAKSVALWMLAVLLAILLFYFFHHEMVGGGGKQGALTDISPALPVAS